MAGTSFEYGPISGPQEVERLGAVIAESFGMAPADTASWFSFAGANNLRAYRRDGQMVGGFVFVHMAQFFGGRSVGMGGFSGVAIAPWARGGGTGTRLMIEGVRELRALGYPLSALYPATQPIYRRAGFEQAGARFELQAPLSALPVGERSLPVRPFTPDDLPAVKLLYANVARTRDGWIDRGPYMWHRVQNLRGNLATGYIVGEGRDVEGYVFVLKTRKSTFLLELALTDLVARTPRAWRRLMTLLADHGSIAEDVTWYGGANDPLLLGFQEQTYRARVKDSWMLRILDVEKALSGRGYAAGLSGTLQLEVTDELFPENTGRFVLEVSGREGRVRRGGDGSLRCDVRALATLYTGYRSATLLEQAGVLTGAPEAIETADAIFAAASPPSMADMF